jgi:hypothetical protein
VRKRLIVDIFLAIDERVSEGRKGRGDGKLTIDDLSELFDGKNHPEVKAGRLSASAALTEMITSFEGKNGNRDGEVSLKEWTSYYGDLSASFENDDHFAAMMMGAWPSIFDPKGAAKGFKVLKPPVPQRDIDNLEALLRRSITSRSTASSETKALEKVFKEFDKDNSKTIGFEEFIVAMERFGLCTATDSRTDVSGVTLEAVRALFDRYDQHPIVAFESDISKQACAEQSLDRGGSTFLSQGIADFDWKVAEHRAGFRPLQTFYSNVANDKRIESMCGSSSEREPSAKCQQTMGEKPGKNTTKQKRNHPGFNRLTDQSKSRIRTSTANAQGLLHRTKSLNKAISVIVTISPSPSR